MLADKRPSCVLRLGYLYGPESEDLKAYRVAFKMARPYWAGPKRNLQHHLHTTDAAAALLEATQRRPRGRVAYAIDDKPASFASFMDHFARLCGNPLPMHIPGIARLPAHLVVAEAHMQMVELGVHGPAEPRLAGFSPSYRDYRAGLAQVVESLEGEKLTEASTVTVDRDGHVLLMGLNRPEKRNAFNRAMLDDLSLAYGELDRDPELRCGVLFAHGDHFTGGLDLVDVAPRMAGGWVWPEGGIDFWA